MGMRMKIRVKRMIRRMGVMNISVSRMRCRRRKD